LRHRKILNAAAFAANVAAGREHPDGPEMAPLYDYCRARGFPPPETLARKFGEMQGQPFPYVSLAEAPEGINVFFTTFRAVAQALEPFREEQGPAEPVDQELDTVTRDTRASIDAILAETGCSDRQDLVDMASVGTSLMETIDLVTRDGPLKGWVPAESPVEIVTDLLNMIDSTEQDEPGPLTPTGAAVVARAAHEINRAYCAAIGDLSQPSWDDAPSWQKQSAINGVLFHEANPDASPAASHESWLAEKAADGWKHGPIKDPEKKEHPCFLPYDELPVEQRAKDYLFAAVCRLMLAREEAGDGKGEDAAQKAPAAADGKTASKKKRK
jgi:hypothetical protein